MLKNLSITEAELIYLGLKSLIETKSGHGLVNADGGHLVYISGLKEQNGKDHDFGDSPNKNTLYKLLHELSNKLKKERDIESHRFEWWYDFKDWKSFCAFVVQSYRQ